ncbi:MAG: KH domain-containing protein [bacterium]|nr:KH domain-containing protein [bacterium]
MELKEFTEFLVKSIVSDEDAVRVSEFKLEDDLIIEVLVSDVDRSLVIGKNGKMANSIRTLVQARAYIMNLGKVKLNIDSV